MSWFKNFFSTKREFVGNFIETGEGLLELTHSNSIAAAELGQFKAHVERLTDKKEIEAEAVRSANALSGYGISVSPMAFIEAVDD